MQSAGRPVAGDGDSQLTSNRKEFIEYVETRTDLIHNIRNSIQNMKSALQKGQVSRKVVQNLIEDIPMDIQNIIDGLQDGPYVQQIALNDQDSFQTIKTNLNSMKNSLRAIQADISDIEDPNKIISTPNDNCGIVQYKCAPGVLKNIKPHPKERIKVDDHNKVAETFKCDSAPINTSDQNILDTHMRSNLHQRNVSQLEPKRFKCIKSQPFPNDNSPREAIGVKHPAVIVKPYPIKMLAPGFGSKGSATSRPTTGCFRCELCGVTTANNFQLEQHLQGAKHRKKLRVDSAFLKLKDEYKIGNDKNLTSHNFDNANESAASQEDIPTEAVSSFPEKMVVVNESFTNLKDI